MFVNMMLDGTFRPLTKNKTYVVGTQKNRLNEMVRLSTQNMLKLIGKKIFTIYTKFFGVTNPVYILHISRKLKCACT